MHERMRICGVGIAAASAILLGACEGKLDRHDASGQQADWGSYPDFSTADAPAGDAAGGDGGGTKEAAAGDSAVTDSAGGKLDGGPVGACATWSGWSCTAGPSPYLCKAACQSGGKKYVLSCLSTGHCVCGVAGGACGPFSFTQACDACKQAISCCSP